MLKSTETEPNCVFKVHMIRECPYREISSVWHYAPPYINFMIYSKDPRYMLLQHYSTRRNIKADVYVHLELQGKLCSQYNNNNNEIIK